LKTGISIVDERQHRWGVRHGKAISHCLWHSEQPDEWNRDFSAPG